MKYSPEIIGKTILEERVKHKMTQAQLGDKLGVTGKQVSNYENGKLPPPVDVLFKLCEVFNCELGYLLGEASYAQGSALETEIHKITGLSKKSMSTIRYITGNSKDSLSFGYDSDKYRKILNALFSSDCFIPLIEVIEQLDICYDKCHGTQKRLKNKLGEERYQKAWEHYRDKRYQEPEYYDGELDYKRDPQAPDLSEEEIHDMVSIDVAIDEEYGLEGDVEIARYYANKAFGQLIDELYPEERS